MEAFSVVRQIWFGEKLSRQIRSVDHHFRSLYVALSQAVAWISLDADRVEVLRT